MIKKHQHKHFFCPLCRTERKLRYSSRLSLLNYLQIATVTLCLAYILFPIMKAKSVFLIFLVWPSFEFINKMLHRKEIPCPECGFDATWYKKDVKVARAKVEEFWKTQNSQEPKVNGIANVASPPTLDSVVQEHAQI